MGRPRKHTQVNQAPIQDDLQDNIHEESDLLSEYDEPTKEDVIREEIREEMRAEIQGLRADILEDVRNSLPHEMENVHESREQESRDSYEFDPLAFEESGPLPEIPARRGYVQRWVRVSIKGKDDARNISTRARRGWRPRQANSVDTSYQHMLVNHQGLTGVIGTQDAILMERPLELHKKVEAIERKKRRDLEIAVKKNIFREHQRIGGSDTGFSAPVNEQTAKIIRGSPIIADD